MKVNRMTREELLNSGVRLRHIVDSSRLEGIEYTDEDLRFLHAVGTLPRDQQNAAIRQRVEAKRAQRMASTR